jgi:hypothetical protein
MKAYIKVNAKLHARPLYPQRKSRRYPLDRVLGGLQSRSGRSGEEKNFQHLFGLEPPIIHAIPRYTTKLSRRHVKFARYELKSIVCLHICNSFPTKNVSYRISSNVYALSPYKIFHA